VLGGIVFEVSVLNEGEISDRILNRGADRGAFSLVVGMLVEPDLRMRGGEALEDGVAAVGRAVVHNDQLPLHVLRQGRDEHVRDTALDHSALVVDRHEDGKLHACISIILPEFSRPYAASTAPGSVLRSGRAAPRPASAIR